MGIMDRWHLFGVCVLALAACRAKEKCNCADDAAATPSASTSAASLPAVHVSLAMFGEDGLTACADFTFAEHFPGSAGGSDASTKDGGRAKLDKNVRELQQRCKEAFSDRKELANCTLKNADDAGVSTVITRYYDATLLDDDHEMKDCLEKGQWHGIGHNDPEYKRSLARGHAKAAQRQLKQLQQQFQADEE
jgi:hypothetical protein